MEELLASIDKGGEDAKVMYFCCPYNRAHRVPGPKLVWHLSRCKDKSSFSAPHFICLNETTHFAEDQTKHEEHCPANVHDKGTYEDAFTMIIEDDERLKDLIETKQGTYCRACKQEVDYEVKSCPKCTLLNPHILFKHTEHDLKGFGVRPSTAVVEKREDQSGHGPDRRRRNNKNRYQPHHRDENR